MQHLSVWRQAAMLVNPTWQTSQTLLTLFQELRLFSCSSLSHTSHAKDATTQQHESEWKAQATGLTSVISQIQHPCSRHKT